ncbi:MAG: 7-carboxy-7-deazaguanine synthase QueE [Campylobacterota bacterium]|nr:7-carboxy-7-deazaguanine synthase QueE [Campylobacterota bacterium]
MLEINEIFGPTIQGEGKRTGNPSVFIRFGKCNLRCPGFAVEYETPSGIKKCSCDSFHAVDTAFKEQWHQYETAQMLIDEVNKIIPNYKVDIVITGGEPLIYWSNPQFQEFLEHYSVCGYHITIETNASLPIHINKEYQKKILYSMSVKLSNSGEPLEKRLNIQTLTHIINHSEDNYLKFVVDKTFLAKAQNEIDTILNDIPKTQVYLMPMGDTSKDIDNNAQSVITMALKNGYQYSDRLHIRVWNNKRGV